MNIPGTMTPIEYEPLARHTSWRVGGAARYYLEVADVAEIRRVLDWAALQELPVFVMGGGTNLLVRDSGFDGLVLRYTARAWHVTATEADEQAGLLYAEAGAPMAGLVRRIVAQGWGGLEWGEGLPGTVGGAIFGNAGCYGGNIATVLERATVLVGDQIQVWPIERMGYGYRTSILKQGRLRADSEYAACQTLILSAELRVYRANPAELAATMARIAAERKGKTPWGSSCGSVFKNPPGESAGRLIERAGLKERRVGNAEISSRHANYIVNLGGASSEDILALIELARNEVLRRFGIELELEVQIVG